MLCDEGAVGLYALLAGMGFGRPTLNFRKSVRGDEASVAVAWPKVPMALSLPGDNPAPLVKAGWRVVVLTAAQTKAIGPLLAGLNELRFAQMLADSAGGAKRTISTDEQRLLAALLAAGLPMPDRNHTVKAFDGSRSVTPDFAWHSVGGVEVKVALELDGWWHHGGRDLDTEIKEIAATDPGRKAQLAAFRKDQQATDAAKRRVLAEHGWQVVAVLDTELADGKTDEVVATVARLIHDRRNAITPTAPEASPGLLVPGPEADVRSWQPPQLGEPTAVEEQDPFAALFGDLDGEG